MIRTILSFLAIISILNTSAQKIEYILDMPHPETHYFDVTLNISGIDQKSMNVKMPVWAPGSYLVREFAKHVEKFSVTSKNKKIPFVSTNKNTWTINTEGSKSISIKYSVYAYELSVRTSFIDAAHGYLNGTSVFMYIDGMKDKPISLDVNPYSSWKKVSTSLSCTDPISFKYTAPDYDILVDSPIEIGNQLTFTFDASGVKHHVAMFGEGNFDVELLKIDMAKIVDVCTEVVGVNPNKEYTFIIHNLTNGSGGLEHLSSTTLQVNRWGYAPEKTYTEFLSLVAHEYFHLWNVKRIRPLPLGPFDYDNENYTHHLWVCEGFTSYYDELLLKRSDYYTIDDYFDKLAGTISRVENQPGNKVQAVSEASFHAWIKAYRPNENSYNTTISYYPKGAMIALALDLQIITGSHGEKNLDDVLKILYTKYYEKENRGFTEDELKLELETLTGSDLTDFFQNNINGTEMINYNLYLKGVGCALNDKGSENTYFGVRADKENGKLKVKSVVRGTAAYQGGLNVNDEIIAVDGFRTIDNDFKKMIESKKVGDVIDLLISRDGIINSMQIPLFKTDRLKYEIIQLESKTDEQKKNYNKWLSL